MCLDYAAADGEAEAGAPSISPLMSFRLIKAVKYLLVEFGGNAVAFISNADDDILAIKTGLEHNPGILWGIFSCVLNQVGEDLTDTVIIN